MRKDNQDEESDEKGAFAGYTHALIKIFEIILLLFD